MRTAYISISGERAGVSDTVFLCGKDLENFRCLASVKPW